jgi:hypothetical protein
MSDQFQPIRLEGPKQDEIHEITSVKEALGFLYSLWPGHTGEQKAAAEEACQRALTGDISVEQARQVFYDAAVEADILEKREE